MLQQTIKAVNTNVTKFAEVLINDIDTNKQNDQLLRHARAEKAKMEIENGQLQEEVLRLQNDVKEVQARTKRLRDAFENEFQEIEA